MNSGPKPRYDLKQYASADALAHSVASGLIEKFEAAERDRQPMHIALSGGRISRNLFQALTQLAAARGLSLNTIHFFWADERCLPPTDPESNFYTANELLFQPLNIATAQIHRIRGEAAPAAAAEQAEQEIRRVVAADPNGQPGLDLILLGLGEDGHVASLFPGESEAAVASPAVYRAVLNSPKPPPARVTLGFCAIAAAKEVWMLASGSGKERALSAALAGEDNPFGRVLRERPCTQIFSDIHGG
ncbi:MAG TPA: 6-phosphogluconolactonase [Verrucomicrobiae bacterium]|nr:6-phosphogluconolactonase [Verrucomicrobiae bacterium]